MITKKIEFMNHRNLMNLAKLTIFISWLCQIDDFPQLVNIASHCTFNCLEVKSNLSSSQK